MIPAAPDDAARRPTDWCHMARSVGSTAIRHVARPQAPDEFCDPLTMELMEDPVRLPTSSASVLAVDCDAGAWGVGPRMYDIDSHTVMVS